MTKNTSLTNTLIHVAHLYYDNNLSQQEIADQIGVSRSLIALYLKKAREQGVVRIEIADPMDNCEDLALMIQEKTGTNRIFVIPSSHNSNTLTRRSLASAVARFLETHLQDGDNIGFAWGRTIKEIGGLFAPSKPRKINVVPLLGESASSYSGFYSLINQTVLQIANSFNGKPHFLLAPLTVGSKTLCEALYKDEVVYKIAQQWDNLTYACMGVGSIPPSSGEVLYIGEENLDAIRQTDAVGDICARYFNIQGNYIHADFNDRMIGINLEQLQKTKSVIAVAEGTEKALAMVGVLRSKLVSHFFIDEDLANAILSEFENEQGRVSI
jgi:deoxyribonucleoside regulator